jgi:vacuolar iron transporter family protein
MECEHSPDLQDHPVAVDHGAADGGWLRPAVFGVSDGLVSNLALVLGVAAGQADGSVVMLAGASGLLAGACSMAAGEWISVQAERERLERELAMEAAHIAEYPEEEAAHMMEILTAAGLPTDLVGGLVAELARRPEANLDFHARVELGIDPDALDSPWTAAIASFISFVVGATIPLIPWVLADGMWAWAASCVGGALGLFIVGAALSRFTSRHWAWSGTRQLLVGAIAAGVTTLIGALVGGAIGG